MLVDGFRVDNAFNQSEPTLQYSGSWSFSPNRGLGDYGDDVDYTTTNGDSVTVYFTGSDATVFGELNSDLGTIGVQVDGISQGTISAYTAGPREAQQPYFSATGLTPGRHTLTLTKESGQYMVIDAMATPGAT